MILKRDSGGTVAPPAFEIAEESLRRSLSPKLRRSLAPIQPASERGKEESTVEGAILARLFPKMSRPLVIDDLAKLDVGWDVGAYSSTINTRDTKPPPAAKTPSKMPTHAPPAPAKKTSKAPPKPAARARPVIRKVGDRPVKGKPKPP